jgi:hypothetical protein
MLATWKKLWTEFRERLLESGPVWTYKNIRWKDDGHVTVHGRWRRWKWRPLYTYRVVVYGAETKAWLSYANRSNDWKVSARDQEFKEWFEANGKGLMRYTVYPTARDIFQYKPDVEVGFTDKSTALMFKLAMGGR